MNAPSGSTPGDQRLRRLLEAGQELAGDLNLERVLGRALDVARELTEAEHAALEVLDERREELENFLSHGIDERTAAAIGEPPRGQGHPSMRTFLEVPLVVDGKAWGNLYLTEKRGGGSFTEADEQTAEVLVGWAGTAIKNAQLYRSLERQRDDLKQANRALEAAAEIARAVGGETELEPILATIVERGRLLTRAGSLAVLLADEEGRTLTLAAASDTRPAPAPIDVAGSDAGRVFRHRRPLRVEHLDPVRLTASASREHPGAMLVPLLFRGTCLGVLVASEAGRREALMPGRDEEPVLLSIAASAATAVGTARSVEESRVRHSLAAAERERARWARELHDDTLQNLAGLRMMVSGARRAARLPEVEAALGESLSRVDEVIAELRRLISDLRPSALDELGAGPALRALAQRVTAAGGPAIEVELDFGPLAPDGRLPPELETTVYRLVQEALANVVAHAEAERVSVTLAVDADSVGVRVADDGQGFDPSGFWRRFGHGRLSGEDASHGFGLPGMRERVALLRGWLDVDSAPGRGTTVTAILPRGHGGAENHVSAPTRAGRQT